MSLSLNTNYNALTAQTSLNPTNRGLSSSISRLHSMPQFNQTEDNATALSMAHQHQSPAAVVTISDEAKQKLAEYQQGTINNAAVAQQAKTDATLKDANAAKEMAAFAQSQIQQQGRATMVTQAPGIDSFLRGG